MLKVDELTITPEESKQLAEAITAVTELYDVPLASEKTIAWVNLAMVVGAVEGTRIAALLINKKKAGPGTKAPNQPRQNMGVTEMPSKVYEDKGVKSPISPAEAAFFTSGAGTM